MNKQLQNRKNMKRRILQITVCLLFAFGANAEKVSVEKAMNAAANYYGKLGNVSLRSGQKKPLTLAYEAKPDVSLRSTGGTDAYYYIFNLENGGGFVVVAGDDRAYPVLGYSFKGNFDYSNAPPVFILWLQNYRDQVAHVIKTGNSLPPDPAWEALENGTLLKDISLRTAVGPLGTAEWAQGNPYNLQCPLLDGIRTITGCTATAMATVMKYHADNGFQAVGTGSHSYKWNGTTLKVDFGTYDWNSMPKTTGAYVSNSQKDAIARLMYHCGVSIESTYGTSKGTSAYPGDVATSLVNNFGYNPKIEYIYKSGFPIRTGRNGSKPNWIATVLSFTAVAEMAEDMRLSVKDIPITTNTA
jgi:hypothetical protein